MTPLCVGVKDAAEMLGVSEWQLRRWIDEGLIPVIKFPGKYPGESNRRVLISVDDLRVFRDAHRQSAPTPNAALSDASRRGWEQSPVRERKRGAA